MTSVNRRQFLRTAGAAGTVAAIGPFVHISKAHAASHPSVPGGWSRLINFTPGQAAIQRINRKNNNTWLNDWYLQRIEDGGGRVNLDYYPLEIKRLPSGWSPEQFIEQVRAWFPVFNSPQVTFSGYDTSEYIRWINDRVVGTFMRFDPNLAKLSYVGGTIPGWAADTLSDLVVVGGEKNSRSWTFSTVHVPYERGGPHAVNGNREFGVKYDRGSGNWVFYIQGADRTNSTFQSIAPVVFGMGDAIWIQVISLVSSWVTANGGQLADGGSWVPPTTVLNRRYSRRHDWDDVKDEVGFSG